MVCDSCLSRKDGLGIKPLVISRRYVDYHLLIDGSIDLFNDELFHDL